MQQELDLDLEPDTEVSENRAADILGISRGSLRYRRKIGRVPPYREVGGDQRPDVILYRVGDLLEYRANTGRGGRREQ